MAQENFFGDDDSIFGVDNNTAAETKELDDFLLNDTPIAKTTEGAKLATQEDKEQARENGKAKSDQDKELEEQKDKDLAAQKKKQEEEDLKQFMEGDEKPVNAAKKGVETDENTDNEELSEIQSIAEGLYKAGIFTKDDEDEETPSTEEEFIDKFNSEKQKVAESMVYQFAGRHGEEYREAFNAIFVDGADPKQYLPKFNDIQSFKDMDMGDEDNQIRVIEASLKNQGWEHDDIRDELKKLKLNSDLETTANRYHKALIKTEEQQLTQIQEQSKQKVEQKKLAEAQYSQSIRTILSEKLKSGEFDGIPVNREAADKAVAFLENKNWKLPSGELITDFDYAILELNRPQNHATKIKLGLLLSKQFESGKPITLDLVPVEKRAVSKENTELFNFGKTKKKNTIGSENGKEGSKKEFSFFDEL